MAASTGEVLFRRGTVNEDVDNEIWDDTALIRAYDRAVGLVKEKLKIKDGGTTNGSAMSESASSIDGSSTRKRRKPKKKKGWKAGQSCQAVYSEDGLMYEATIVSIDHGHRTCVIRYVGFGNIEEASLDDLRPSRGSPARRAQERDAESCSQVDNAESGRETLVSETSGTAEDTESDVNQNSRQQAGSTRDPPRPKHAGRSRPWFAPPAPPISQFNMPHVPGMFPPWPATPSMPNFPIPPWNPVPGLPPMPPPPMVADIVNADDDSLASMLMAWYMSGYHTGYYMGRKRSRPGSPPNTDSVPAQSSKH